MNILINVLGSAVVLEARPWPRGQFYGLGLGLGTYGLGLGTCGLGLGLGTYGLGLGTYGLGLGLEGPGLGFESCINNFLPSPSNSRPDYNY